MDVLSLTPKGFQQLTPEQLREEVGRLTPEQRKRLTPEQIATVMEIIDPRYRLTPDEQRRRTAARKLADSAEWGKVASSSVESMLRSYELGHLTFEEALNFVGRITIGCWPQTRITILGTAAALALRVQSQRRRKPGETKPLYPACIKDGCADLIISLKKRRPDKRRTPGVASRHTYDPSSPLIKEALQILTVMRWFGRKLPRQVDSAKRD